LRTRQHVRVKLSGYRRHIPSTSGVLERYWLFFDALPFDVAGRVSGFCEDRAPAIEVFFAGCRVSRCVVGCGVPSCPIARVAQAPQFHRSMSAEDHGLGLCLTADPFKVSAPRSRYWMLVACVVLAFGVAVSLAGALLWRSSVRTQDRQSFQTNATDVSETLQMQLRRDSEISSRRCAAC
jgi:hypothetical protein